MGDKVPDHGSIPSIWIIPKKNFLKNKFKKSNIVVWPCSVCLVYFVKMPIVVSILGPNSVVPLCDRNMPVRPDISYPKESKELFYLQSKNMFASLGAYANMNFLFLLQVQNKMMRRERVVVIEHDMLIRLSLSLYYQGVAI